DRTLQSGALLDVRLGESYPCVEAHGDARFGAADVCADRKPAEANAGYRILTPQVPRGREPSFPTIGRYYDAYPLTARDLPHLLVSWADGPVEDMAVGEAGIPPDFGIYLFDSRSATRKPIYNDEAYWEIFPKPLRARDFIPEIEPAAPNEFDSDAV